MARCNTKKKEVEPARLVAHSTAVCVRLTTDNKRSMGIQRCLADGPGPGMIMMGNDGDKIPRSRLPGGRL